MLAKDSKEVVYDWVNIYKQKNALVYDQDLGGRLQSND